MYVFMQWVKQMIKLIGQSPGKGRSDKRGVLSQTQKRPKLAYSLYTIDIGTGKTKPINCLGLQLCPIRARDLDSSPD